MKIVTQLNLKDSRFFCNLYTANMFGNPSFFQNMAQTSAKWECDPTSVDYLIETNVQVEKETFSFLWTINEYPDGSHLPEITSPIVVGGPKSKHSWQLVVKPQNKLGFDEQETWFSVYLKLIEFGDNREWRPVTAEFQVNVLDAYGRPNSNIQRFYEAEGSNLNDYEPQSICGLDCFMLSSDIQKLLVKYKLQLHCRIWIYGEPEHVVDNVALCRLPTINEKYDTLKERLSTDFGKLFRESVMTDVEILAGKATFKAHKALLTARSYVFAAMFNTNMIEKEMNSVTIPDFDADVVKGMLEHLYTEETDAMVERAPELLQIAEKYNLVGLKSDCECTIATKLNKDNVAVILILAHNYCASYLKTCAISFIKRNKDELLKTKTFQDTVKANMNSGAFSDFYFLQPFPDQDHVWFEEKLRNLGKYNC